MKYLHAAAAALILAIAFFVFQVARSFGFPDGAITEIERAERPLLYVFGALSVVCAGLLVLLPMRARRWVWAAYIVVAAIAFFIDRHFVATLAGGGGG